jgi:hypothetical protein
MLTTTTDKIDDRKCRLSILFNYLNIKSFFENIYFLLFYLDTDFDLITTTISPIISNVCQNQTISFSDEIENRINVVVPYLVLLGK